MRGGDEAFAAFVGARSTALLRFAYLLAPEPTQAQDLLLDCVGSAYHVTIDPDRPPVAVEGRVGFIC